MSRSLRHWHRTLSVIIAMPLAIVVLTGILLQWRSQFEGLQPKTIVTVPASLPLLTIEDALKRVEGEVEQVIYRPGKNALAVRMSDGLEVQLNPYTGEVLKKAPRRTNFLIELHQGSLFGSWSQFGLFPLTGLGLLFLLVSGLLIYPWKRSEV